MPGAHAIADLRPRLGLRVVQVTTEHVLTGHDDLTDLAGRALQRLPTVDPERDRSIDGADQLQRDPRDRASDTDAVGGTRRVEVHHLVGGDPGDRFGLGTTVDDVGDPGSGDVAEASREWW